MDTAFYYFFLFLKYLHYYQRYSNLNLSKILKTIKTYFTEMALTWSKNVQYLFTLFRIYMKNATIFMLYKIVIGSL
jgi:hypothetical protein